MAKVLFILKRRHDYNAEMHSALGLSTGLYNSASFVDTMLYNNHIESRLVVVTDNSNIDKEVHEYRPTHVVIEALWVVPSKFEVLKKLHPTVTWIIRLHSELPFLAGEGMAMGWLCEYSTIPNIVIAANSPRMLREVRMILKQKNNWTDKEANSKVIYLPNYYPEECVAAKSLDKRKDTIDVGCFGAVRLLKNHLTQAIAAIDFANKEGKKLRFHINAGRIEMQGQPVLNNLKCLFSQIENSGHELINHEWSPREDFLKLCASMDIGLQISFSETFNIVGCDLISQGIPLVGSDEIPWFNPLFSASPTDTLEMVRKLKLAYHFPKINVITSRWLMTRYTKVSERIWVQYFKN